MALAARRFTSSLEDRIYQAASYSYIAPVVRGPDDPHAPLKHTYLAPAVTQPPVWCWYALAQCNTVSEPHGISVFCAESHEGGKQRYTVANLHLRRRTHGATLTYVL